MRLPMCVAAGTNPSGLVLPLRPALSRTSTSGSTPSRRTSSTRSTCVSASSGGTTTSPAPCTGVGTKPTILSVPLRRPLISVRSPPRLPPTSPHDSRVLAAAAPIRTPHRTHTIRGNCVLTADTRCVAVVCQEHDDTASYPGCAAPSVSTPPSRTATCDTGARTSCPGVVSASTCRSDRGQLPQLQLALARVSSSCPAPLRAVRTGGASWSDAHNVCAHESRARHHLSSLSASRLPSRATGRVRPPNPPSPAPNRPQRSDPYRHLRLPHRLGVSDFEHRVLILPQLLPVLVASLASRIPCREPRYHD